MELDKLSYWEYICRQKFNIEKCKVQYIGSKNIQVENKLSNKEIKKVNEECNLRVGFDETFKADNHILSIVLRPNGIIGCMVRNFYFKGGKCCFKNI